MNFKFGVDMAHGLPRNNIALTSRQYLFKLLFSYDAHEHESDFGTVTPQPNHRQEHAFRDWWVWEMLGALLSMGCMIAVVMLGLLLDGLSLSDWSFTMAPSTIISALVTIAKTSMLLPVAEGLSQLKWIHFSSRQRSLRELEAFDDASGGPWGSVTLVWKIKARSLLALCGAFLTIASLSMGPFAQQIVSLEYRRIPQGGAAIQVTNAYNETQYEHCKYE